MRNGYTPMLLLALPWMIALLPAVVNPHRTDRNCAVSCDGRTVADHAACRRAGTAERDGGGGHCPCVSDQETPPRRSDSGWSGETVAFGARAAPRPECPASRSR